MKVFTSALFLTVLGLTTKAQDWSSKEPFLTKSFPATNVKELKVETSGGNITVEGGEGEARVEMYIWPSNGRDRDMSKEEMQKKLDEEYELTIGMDGQTLQALAKRRHDLTNWKHSLSISFRIYSPHHVSSLLRTSGGNIALSGLEGDKQDFRTSGGNLSINKLGGDITGRTSGGNISVSDAKDKVDLATSGGNITAERCDGQISLSTSGGNLSLRSLKGTIKAGTSGGQVGGQDIAGELSTHTSGGNVHLSGLSCSLDASTSGGNIDVTMTGIGKFVKLSNSGGNTALQIPQDQGIDLKLYGDRISTSTLNNFKGDVDKKHITGTLNGGGIPVTIDGGSGGVSLTLR